MNKYAEDCILLDTARRQFLACLRDSYKNLWLLERRVKTMYGRAMSVEAMAALVEQREKLRNLAPFLADFIDYMDDPRAWMPAQEKVEAGFDFVVQTNAEMDELLKKL